MFRENIGLRLISVLLALLIWLQSVLVTEQKSVINLPINLRYVPQNVTLENIPQHIPFSVQGKGQDILKMVLFKPRVNIDASKISPGMDILSLEDYSIDLPENVNVTFLGPASSDKIAIQADVFHQKVVPVVPEFQDELLRSRLADLRYSLDPEKVTIFGPKNRIKSITGVSTEAIGNAELAESQSRLALILPPGDVSISESSVLLTISGAQEATKVFPNVILPAGYLPSRVAVKLQGESAVLDKISGLRDIKASISAEPDAAGLFSVVVELPEDVQLIAITPDKVRARP